MKILFFILIHIFFLLSAVHAKEVLFYHVKVTKIVDGDSFHAIVCNYPINVRLYGIDTPEKRQSGGEEAKKELEKLISIDDIVFIEVINFANFGRPSAILHLENEKTAQEELLKTGNAWIYPEYCKQEICKSWQKLEKNAQENKIGLWENDRAIPPWEFRKK